MPCRKFRSVLWKKEMPNIRWIYMCIEPKCPFHENWINHWKWISNQIKTKQTIKRINEKKKNCYRNNGMVKRLNSVNCSQIICSTNYSIMCSRAQIGQAFGQAEKKWPVKPSNKQISVSVGTISKVKIIEKKNTKRRKRSKITSTKFKLI